MTNVISLGGSIVAPDKVDESYLEKFVGLIKEFLLNNVERRFIIVVGGGGPARTWQSAYRNVGKTLGDPINDEAADWIGIMATRLNAQLVKALFGAYCTDDVITDPNEERRAPDGTARIFTGRVLLAAGWKPGFSSDNDAALLAKRFGAKTIINLSNIEKVYTADPKTDPLAKPLDDITWKEFRAITGNEWTPGKNVPFDPIASRTAEDADIDVICAAGRNLENLRQILCYGLYTGTLIHS
ncbi:MAG: UMP kinase [Spirochaetaceae bacterium]|jgi:uridylate kinase|nr:UMP kinase [Spirochaetaceae bacterium]